MPSVVSTIVNIDRSWLTRITLLARERTNERTTKQNERRASTPELGQGAANTRMTQEERRELARVQREVMWNLQKDEVVTIVRQGDDPVPYKRQGNPAVNTPISVRKRLSLRHKPLIQVLYGKNHSDSTCTWW